MRMVLSAVWILQCLLTLSASEMAPQRATPAPPSARGGLRIVVISGEDAVNIIQQRTAVAPLVEVRDRNDQPVAGAVVTFTIQGGRNAAFAAGGNTLTVTTNAVGQAAVAGLTPTGAGAVQINVAAAFQGQAATAAITQTNVATAAQAASAASGSGTSGSGTSGATAGAGGGGIGAGTITLIAAAAAGTVGGLYGYRQYVQGEAPAIIGGVRPIPTSGIQGGTPVSLLLNGNSTWHGSGATWTADFGDGTQITATADDGGGTGLNHVYASAGTFTVRLTLKDAWDRTASAQGTVIIKSLTGRWTVGTTGAVFTLTQSGGVLSGTYTTAAGPGSGTVSGTIRAQQLVSGADNTNVTLTVAPIGAGAPTTFVGGTSFADNAADFVPGTLTSGSASLIVQLLRQ